MSEPTPVRIERQFVRLNASEQSEGQMVHVRSAGERRAGQVPLWLLHSGPGSSAGLVPMLRVLGREHWVLAPDMPGNGDSDPLPNPTPSLADYVAHTVALMDALGMDQVDLYGQHTGAHIACELVLTHPQRVRSVALDGIALFDDELRLQMKTRYAPPMRPDDHGGHLAWAWHFIAGLTLHFPYYLPDPAHRLHHSAVPPATARQALLVEMLKAWPSYHLGYQAVGDHLTAQRLPLLRHPCLLVGAEGDPLSRYVEPASALIPHAQVCNVTREGRARALQSFVLSLAAS